MAAAIFFVSGGPLVWGPLFFVPQGGVWVCGVLVLVRVCCVRGGLYEGRGILLFSA